MSQAADAGPLAAGLLGCWAAGCNTVAQRTVPRPPCLLYAGYDGDVVRYRPCMRSKGASAVLHSLCAA
jgi:hypothetical protein